MPTYKYVAKNKAGKSVVGILEAANQSELVAMLRKKDLIIVKINEIKGIARIAPFSFKKGKVKIDDLVIFSRQLATMVDAGIPLVTALDILGEQVEDKKFKQVILKVRDDVETGSSLSDSFSKHPAAFSNFFVNMVKAGESSGTLDEIMDRVATYIEKTSSLRRKVRSAMIYPAVVTTMAIGITAILLIKVIPVFKDIYSGFGAQLPKPTMVLIAVSDFLQKYFFFITVVMGVIIFILARYAKTEKGRLIRDRYLLKLPIFGILLRKVAVSRFARTLSTLVRSGVPILSSLEIVGKTSGNKAVELAVDEVRTSIKEGENIAEPLAKSGVFPSMVVRMVSVGEKAGELEKMLSKVADFYEEQVNTAVTGLTSMIEPLIIAFLGIVVGTIVIFMFLPIFRISTINIF